MSRPTRVRRGSPSAGGRLAEQLDLPQLRYGCLLRQPGGASRRRRAPGRRRPLLSAVETVEAWGAALPEPTLRTAVRADRRAAHDELLGCWSRRTRRRCSAGVPVRRRRHAALASSCPRRARDAAPAIAATRDDGELRRRWPTSAPPTLPCSAASNQGPADSCASAQSGSSERSRHGGWGGRCPPTTDRRPAAPPGRSRCPPRPSSRTPSSATTSRLRRGEPAGQLGAGCPARHAGRSAIAGLDAQWPVSGSALRSWGATRAAGRRHPPDARRALHPAPRPGPHCSTEHQRAGSPSCRTAGCSGCRSRAARRRRTWSSGGSSPCHRPSLRPPSSGPAGDRRYRGTGARRS